MSRPITDLLPDIRLAASGVPEMVATYYLTRSLSEFLDRSEAWREWLPVRTIGDITDGIASWPNHLDDETQRWARIKRIDKMRWYPTGNTVEFKTASQLQDIDPEWRSRQGARAFHYTNESEAPAGAEDEVSGFRIRLYPIPAADIDPTHGVETRAVVVTDVVANMGLGDFDDQIPTVPDRVFYPWRNAIVDGALSSLYLMPGKDWTDPGLAAVKAASFAAAIVQAKSRADAEYGNPKFTTGYGGIP